MGSQKRGEPLPRVRSQKRGEPLPVNGELKSGVTAVAPLFSQWEG